MTQELWTAVDTYIKERLLPEDRVLAEALRNATDAGLPVIAVSPTQGKLLHLLVKMCGARKILEIGTLAGYSTIWMARALPAGGRVITLELDPKHAAVAHKNFELAGLETSLNSDWEAHSIPCRHSLPKGRARSTSSLSTPTRGTFPAYFEWALKLSRPGTTIIVDNIIRDGEVIDASSEDPNIQGVRRFNDMLKSERRASATEIQTVGEKGYDGFALVIVNE